MGIQALLDNFSEKEMYRRVATGQNMSLGALIDALEELPGEMRVEDSAGNTVKSLGSYRGYYSDLALHVSDWGRTEDRLETVAVLLPALEAAVGATYQGYKGGDFTMQQHTPMWFASYGDTGSAVHGIEVRDGKAVLILVADEL